MKKIIASLTVCGAGLWAQSPDPAKQLAEQRQLTLQVPGGTLGMSTIGIQAGMAGPVATISGAPYSAEAVTERVQTLLDGNRILQTTSNMVARDSHGRVRREESLAIALPGVKEDGPKLVMIDDPVAGVHWTLDPHSNTASKSVFPKAGSPLFSTQLPAPGPEKVWFYSSGAPGSQVVIQKQSVDKAEAEANTSRVDLGTQTIEGVPAQGTRITRTIPAGEVGNEEPIIINSETWYSPDLKVLVMSKAEDPRMGVTSYRLTHIQRSEPPATLFEVPADYTVKENTGGMVLYKGAIKNQ